MANGAKDQGAGRGDILQGLMYVVGVMRRRRFGVCISFVFLFFWQSCWLTCTRTTRRTSWTCVGWACTRIGAHERCYP